MANDFLPFATDPAANVISQGAWAALAARPGGFVSGVARSNQVNKVLRQAAAMVAAMGGLIDAYSDRDALDDGDIASLTTKIAQTIQAGMFSYVAATGTANAWVLSPTPAVPSYSAGRVLWVIPPATNTSTTVNVNISTLGDRRIKKSDGNDPAIGDLVSGKAVPTIDDGTSIRVIGALASDYSQPMNQEFITASKSFVAPASTLWIEGVGGGGAGGASGTGTIIGIAGNMGAGGGGGGFFRKVVSGLTIGSTITATIGAGGVPVNSVGGGVGGNGGTTSFGSHASASGGGGGAWGENTSQPGGSSGMGVGGDLNLGGAPGGRTGPNNTTPTASDILTIYGRGGSAFGGLSVLNLVSTGSPGLGFGTGGNGASGGSGVAGGAGAPGYIWVRW